MDILHILIRVFKEKSIEIYQLRGYRYKTAQEYNAYINSLTPEDLEISKRKQEEFEKEYEEWKKNT